MRVSKSLPSRVLGARGVSLTHSFQDGTTQHLEIYTIYFWWPGLKTFSKSLTLSWTRSWLIFCSLSINENTLNFRNIKVLLLKLICKENEIQYCESKIFIIYSQSRSRWVPWKIKEWSRLFPLKKWYCVKWIVMHGRMRALEERGGGLVLLMRSRAEKL